MFWQSKAAPSNKVLYQRHSPGYLGTQSATIAKLKKEIPFSNPFNYIPQTIRPLREKQSKKKVLYIQNKSNHNSIFTMVIRNLVL